MKSKAFLDQEANLLQRWYRLNKQLQDCEEDQRKQSSSTSAASAAPIPPGAARTSVTNQPGRSASGVKAGKQTTAPTLTYPYMDNDELSLEPKSQRYDRQKAQEEERDKIKKEFA